MEQNPKSDPSKLEDPLLLGEVLEDFFGMDPAAMDAAIDDRRTQVREKLIEHHGRSLRDALDARSKDEIEEGDDTIRGHQRELWKLDAENKGVHGNE